LFLNSLIIEKHVITSQNIITNKTKTKKNINVKRKSKKKKKKK